MKLLLVGSSGYLAHHLKIGLCGHELYFCSQSDVNADVVTDADGNISIQKDLSSVDYVVFLSALTSIAQCEKDPPQAHRVNVSYVMRVHAQLAKKFSFVPVYISTDAVFYSVDDAPLFENSIPKPKCEYGKTKRKAEEYFLSLDTSVIIRLPRLWDLKHPKCFSSNLLRGLQKNAVRYIISDQYFRCAYTPEVITVIESILTQQGRGIFHLSGREYLSWKNILCLLGDISSIPEVTLDTVSNYHSPRLNFQSNRIEPLNQSVRGSLESLVDVSARITS